MPTKTETAVAPRSRGLMCSKLTIMLILLVLDMACNSSADYDSYMNSDNSNVVRGLLFISIVVEISVFLILFLAMAETYIFRVGLLGLLLKQFRAVLICHVIYLAFTLCGGAYRYYLLINRGGDVLSLWENRLFIALALAQKCVAIPYYILNMRAVVKLSKGKYFQKGPWIALIQQNMRLAKKRKLMNDDL